jgi:glycolate oxidase
VKLILKGIATPEDAEIACEHGVEGVYVSNHGGRQLDHGRGAVEVLPEVVKAVRGRAQVIIDGSFCRGSDVVKAIALGADLVGMGRMYCYALAAAGAEGVERMLEILEAEVIEVLGLLGVASLAEVNGSFLHAAQPTNLPHVLSAFPLLRLEDSGY